MATYKQIQQYVKKESGFEPKPCWIADVKEKCGLPVRKAHNRVNGRKNPCPDNKIKHIKDAFRHFDMI